MLQIKQEDEKPITNNNNNEEQPHSTVSVVRYNSEIELSTDTDDSASETTEKTTTTTTSDFCSKIEEMLKSVMDDDVRKNVLELVRDFTKENERLLAEKDNKIGELEGRIAKLEEAERKPPPPPASPPMMNGDANGEDLRDEEQQQQQTSVIAASVEQKAIVLTVASE